VHTHTSTTPRGARRPGDRVTGRVTVSARLALCWLLALAPLAACPAPCADLCAKLDRCDLSVTLSRDECTEACSAQQDYYNADAVANEELEDVDKEEEKAYRRHRTCLTFQSCEALEAGECFDDVLFPSFGGVSAE
jgi:hypothetical protein